MRASLVTIVGRCLMQVKRAGTSPSNDAA